MTMREGGCRCGQVRFAVDAPPLVTMACHCTGCRRMTASAFSLSALYPAENFAVTRGDPVIGGLHGATQHFFCPHCLSWLFTRPEGGAPFVNVRSTMFDQPSPSAPFFETYTCEKLPWATTLAIHSFERFPPPEQYPILLAGFAAQTSES